MWKCNRTQMNIYELVNHKQENPLLLPGKHPIFYIYSFAPLYKYKQFAIVCSKFNIHFTSFTSPIINFKFELHRSPNKVKFQYIYGHAFCTFVNTNICVYYNNTNISWSAHIIAHTHDQKIQSLSFVRHYIYEQLRRRAF